MKYSTGEKIRASRKEMGLTQRQLAEELKVSVNTVARWEREVSKLNPSATKKTELLLERFKDKTKTEHTNVNASEGLPWNAIDNDKTFQRLSNYLFSFEVNCSGFIPSSPYIGADGGWDGLHEGTYSGYSGRWSIQAKWKSKNYREAYASLRRDLTGWKGRVGEIEKACKNQVDYLLIRTNAELHVPHIEELQNLEKGSLRKIIVQAREDLSLRINQFPWLKPHFFGIPQNTLLVPVSAYFQEVETDLQPWTIGRGEILEEIFKKIIGEGVPLVVVSAAGGYGKSHVLRDLARRLLLHDEWQPWFVVPGLVDPRLGLDQEIVSRRKYVIFFDDAEKFPQDLAVLGAFVRRHSEFCRLVIGTRTAGLDVVKGILWRLKLADSYTFPVPGLSHEEQADLLSRNAKGVTIRESERLLKFLGRWPYLIVLAGRQISGGSDVRSLNDVWDRLVEDYLRECELTLPRLHPEQVRDLIFELSLVVPLRLEARPDEMNPQYWSDHRITPSIADSLEIRLEDLRKYLQRLKENGLLRVIGNAYRFSPDMRGDLCLRHRLQQRDAERFVTESLKKWLELAPEKVLTNLAAASRGDREGAAHAVIQDLVRQWVREATETPPWERLKRIRSIERAAFLAPDQVLNLINAYVKLSEEQELESSFLGAGDYQSLLTSIGSMPGYWKQVAPILLSLLEKVKSGGQTRQSVLQAFSTLVNPTERSAGDIKGDLDCLYELCRKETETPQLRSAVEAFIRCASEVLAGSHEDVDFFEDKVTIRYRVMHPAPWVLECRQHALSRLSQLLYHPLSDVRALVIKAFQDHGKCHPTLDPEKIHLHDVIKEERKQILCEIENRLGEESDLAVLCEIETLLCLWWAMEEPWDDVAARLLRKFDTKRTPEYAVYSYFVKPYETIPYKTTDSFGQLQKNAPKQNRWQWWVKNRIVDQKSEDLKSLAHDLISACPSAESLVQFFVELEAKIEPSRPWANPSIIEAIDAEDPGFCKKIRVRSGLWNKLPDRFKVHVDLILSKRSSSHTCVLADQLFSDDRKLTQEDAGEVRRFLVSLRDSDIPLEKRSEWIGKISKTTDQDVLEELSEYGVEALKEDPTYIVPLLKELVEKMVGYRIFPRITYVLKQITARGVPSGQPLEDLKNTLKEKLLVKPQLDQGDEDLLDIVFDNDLHGLIEFVENRVEQEVKSGAEGKDFEAIPFHGLRCAGPFVKDEQDFEQLLQLSYRIESRKPWLRHRWHTLMPSVPFEFRPYVISSCEELLKNENYKENHSYLWWLLKKLSLVVEDTESLFLKALQRAETNGILDDTVEEVMWDILVPSSLREDPPQLVRAREVARQLKNTLAPGQARSLIERIEKSIQADIDQTRQRHEALLNES